MQSEKEFQEFIRNAPAATITDQSGNTTTLTGRDVITSGLSGQVPATGPKPVYKTSNGWSMDYADSVASITLDKSTGNIKITAPKEVYESEAFKNVFDDEVLKEYSQAYKLNNDYKISVREKNEETGEEEDKEITIPEYVERLNTAINNYMENLRNLHAYKSKLQEKYGDKANNLSDELLQISNSYDGKAIYLPATIFNIGSFGKGTNPFLGIQDKVTEDGMISVEELKKIYNRDNFGRDEMAAILAAIDGTLRGSSWDVDGTYTDDDGVVYNNPNSAEEAAKLLAFRNYITSVNPKSTDIQQMGEYIESFVYNAANQVTKIFGNMAGLAQYTISGFQDDTILEGVEQMDEAMSYFNENEALAWDAATNAQIWGTLGGMALGTWGSGKIIGLGFKGIGAASGAYTAKYLSLADKMAKMVDAGEEISLGARMVYKSLSLAEKMNLLVSMAASKIGGVVGKNFFTEYIFDTMHDAILYDANGLRHMLQDMSKAPSTDQKVWAALSYWAQQYTDNAKFWAPMGVGRALIKTAGKTTLGKAANIVLTKYINKAKAAFGDSALKGKYDLMSGSTVAKLEDKIKKAEAAGETAKANRLKVQKNTLQWQGLLKDAKAKLGDVKLEWDGVRLTEKSAKEWADAMTRIKALENGIDAYVRGVDAETRVMLSKIKNPATGNAEFLYEELAGANIRASKWYYDLVGMSEKHGLKAAEKGLLNQDVIDYWMGSFKRDIYQGFAKAGTENAAKAQEALKTINDNLASLRGSLPEDIVKFIDEGVKSKVYQDFYKQLNRYGTDNNLLVKDIIDGYENNPIWLQNGYMPIAHDVDLKGRWIREDDKIESIVEQEMDKLKFSATAGEHFKDPELVRQVRIRHMAQAKVNADIWKSYSGWGSDATNVTIVSGEETEFARRMGDGMQKLQEEIAAQAKGAFEENLVANIVKKSVKAPSAKAMKAAKESVVASISPSDLHDYMRAKGLVKGSTGKMTKGVTVENYEEWYNGLNNSAKKYLKQQYSNYEGANNYTKLKQCIKEGGDDFETGLERAYLLGDKNFESSNLLKGATKNLKDGQDAFYGGVFATRLKGELSDIKGIDTGKFIDDLVPSIEGLINEYVKGVVNASSVKTALDALAGTADGSEDAARYLVLRELAKSDNLIVAQASLAEQIKDLAKGKNIGSDDLDKITKASNDLLSSMVKDQANEARLMALTFNPDIANGKEFMDEVKAINKKITEAEERVGEDYVMYLDDHGRKVYAQVDPAFASLFNYRYRMEKAEASAMAKINGIMSRAYRYGTTSVNLKSFGNQLFRDFGNALMVGGAWQTIKTNADNLTNVFGKNIVDHIKQFEPAEMQRIEKIAEESGRSVESVAVSRELMRGAAKAPSTTERTLYKEFMKKAYAKDSETVLTNMKNSFQEFIDKYNPEDLLNGKRENYLRNRVFASSLNDAMKQGYTLEQARVFADFAMNNATTNFTRQLYHMQAIADSTPYFRAAINGHKSFWRMWSLDPVGISGRIMGGLIIPTMYLTGASLGTEEDKKVYMNIPEYEKENAMVFVLNGQAVSIPVPQEMSSIVAPFRQFVEHLNDADTNAYWDLMMNNLLGFAPIDLKGFSTVDMDKMISDPSFFDRVNRGVSRLFSSMAPVPLKSTYMLATGIDPYSGKSLRDKKYMYWNDETNSVEVMDYNSNAFAKVVADVFGDWITPELAEKIISGTVGTTGSDVLGALTELVQENGLEALKSIGKSAAKQISGPFDITEYDYTTAVWKRAIRQLTSEKEALLNNEKMKTLNTELSQTKDPEKRKKLLAERQTMTDSFHQKVQSTVERLSTEYKGTLDRQKLAAVINLLNFNSNPSYQSGSQYSSDLSSKEFWNGKSAAIHTLERMGVTGSSDMSIFGYLATDTDGNPIMKYSSPVAIMDMDYQWDTQDKVHAANLRALISQENLYDAHKAVNDQIQKIYGSKKKLTNQDYANIEAIQINWNAQLAKTIAPYISQMTPEAAINNKEVLNSLYPYVEVPNSWEKNNKGKSVSLGDRGNKKMAYYESWIKSLFSVNDPYKGQY